MRAASGLYQFFGKWFTYMEKATLRHGFAIAFLLGITAAILFAVSSFRPTYTIAVDEPMSTAAGSAVSLPEDSTVAEETTQESLPADWLPSIEYDSYTPSEIDPQAFRETVVLGNSQAQALQNFGLLKNADFVTRIGLSIHKVISDGTASPPIAHLYGKQYHKAVFIFGENELGWPYPENFISHYKKVIAKVRELNPGIEVYCQAIFPVSAESSAKSTTGITNENVRKFNGMIEEMCTQIDASFMPYSTAFTDLTGALPADAAVDGIHFGYDYCKIWAGDLSAYLQTQDDMVSATEEGVTVS